MDLFSMKEPPASKLHAREMKFPATTLAKMRQFPFRFYWRNNPMFRNMFYGWVVATYVSFKIQGLVKQPAVWDDWMGKRAKDYADVKHHKGAVQHDADHAFAHDNLQHLEAPFRSKH